MMTVWWHLLSSFGQIGLFALGGGNSMLKLIEDECVNNRHWLSLEEYASLVGVSYLFPGLTVVKLAGLIGLKVGGVPGLILSVIGISLPGLVLAGLFYSAILAYRENLYVKKLLVLMQYAAVALFAAALYSLTRPMLKDLSWQAGLLAAGLFVAVALFEVSPFVALVAFVLIGVFVI